MAICWKGVTLIAIAAKNAAAMAMPSCHYSAITSTSGSTWKTLPFCKVTVTVNLYRPGFCILKAPVVHRVPMTLQPALAAPL